MGKQVKARKYTNDQKINAAVLYAHKGTFCAVARDMNIPRTTLIGWSKQGLWDDAVVKARHQIREHILAKNLSNAVKAGDELADRIENGDQKLFKVKKVITHEDGSVEVADDYELRAEPMRGRDLAVVGGIMQDKAARDLGLPTQIHAQAADAQIQALIKEFKEISESYREKQVKVVSTQ